MLAASTDLEQVISSVSCLINMEPSELLRLQPSELIASESVMKRQHSCILHFLIKDVESNEETTVSFNSVVIHLYIFPRNPLVS